MEKNVKKYLFKIVMTGILVALNVIMERFMSYNVWNMSIGFSFITIGFAATYLGIPYSIAVAALGDLIGALLFPFGTYFPGFTLTNAIVGLVLGIFLYKSTNVFKITLAVLINKVFCTLLLNSIWISILYRGGIDALWAVIVPRIITTIPMFIIEIIVLTLLFSNKYMVIKISFKENKIKNQIEKLFK